MGSFWRADQVTGSLVTGHIPSRDQRGGCRWEWEARRSPSQIQTLLAKSRIAAERIDQKMVGSMCSGTIARGPVPEAAMSAVLTVPSVAR